MIGENIRRARKAKGLSQEELAVQLNVVRQTVSKWENALSVPDADVLILLARQLEVPVSQLLGTEAQAAPPEALAQELARLNQELTDRSRRERLAKQAAKKRGLILLLCFASLWAVHGVQNGAAALLLFGGCALAALGILYRNLALLTGVTADGPKTKPLRITTIFSIALLVFILTTILLDKTALLPMTEEGGKLFASALLVVLMLFTGYMAPRLPFNRHTGLRLPWTVVDEDTWNVAHRALGVISVPMVLLYLAACWAAGRLDAVDPAKAFSAVYLAAVCLYAGIPGLISLIFYWRKLHGKC